MNQRITALVRQQRNPHRVNVYLNGEFAFGLSNIVAAWLEIGQELDADKIASLKSDDNEEIAFQKALRFSKHRMRTEYEIRKHLDKHDFSTEIINKIIERLCHNGFINDTLFAKNWVENRNEFRPRAHRMLFYELRQKGINQEIIEQTLATTISDEDLAFQAANKQARKYKDLEWPDYRRKLSGFLARRGFSYHTISLVLDQIWANRRFQDITRGSSNLEVSK